MRKGEVLAIDTHDNLAEARSDVMGIMLAYAYETEDLAGGTPAPPEPTPPPAATAPPGGHHHGHRSLLLPRTGVASPPHGRMRQREAT